MDIFSDEAEESGAEESELEPPYVHSCHHVSHFDIAVHLVLHQSPSGPEQGGLSSPRQKSTRVCLCLYQAGGQP